MVCATPGIDNMIKTYIVIFRYSLYLSFSPDSSNIHLSRLPVPFFTPPIIGAMFLMVHSDTPSLFAACEVVIIRPSRPADSLSICLANRSSPSSIYTMHLDMR